MTEETAVAPKEDFNVRYLPDTSGQQEETELRLNYL
jgi:predicted component of type VI protein secretion system